MSHRYNDDVEEIVADMHAVLASTLVTTMKEKIGGLFEKYAVYKETHDAVMCIPAVRSRLPDPASLAVMSATSEHDNMLIQRLIAENDALKLQIEQMKSAHAADHDHASLPECCDHHNDEHRSSTANIQLIITDIIVSDVPAQNKEIVFEDDDVDDDMNENLLAEESEDEEEDEEEEEVIAAEEEEEVIAAEEEEEQEVTVEEEEAEVTAEEEEEEEEEVTVEEEEEEEVTVEEEEEEEVTAEEEEEEEVEVIEVEINGKPYFTTDEISGIIYECTKDGDIGNEVGRFVGGRPKFDKK
jgi:hypothetical protein